MFRWPLHVLLSLTDTEASPWRLRHSRRRAKCISDTLESEPSKVVLLVGVRGFLPWGGGVIGFQDNCRLPLSNNCIC